MNEWIRQQSSSVISLIRKLTLPCRLNRDIMKEVEQEFLVTKTIQEMETNRDMDVNFVGLFITAGDKVSSLGSFSAANFHSISVASSSV